MLRGTGSMGKASEEEFSRLIRHLPAECPVTRTLVLGSFRAAQGPPGRPKATAPWLPPRLYIIPARPPVRPAKKPSKLPVAPAPQLGVQPMLSGVGFGRPAIGVPLYAEKY